MASLNCKQHIIIEAYNTVQLCKVLIHERSGDGRQLILRVLLKMRIGRGDLEY